MVLLIVRGLTLRDVNLRFWHHRHVHFARYTVHNIVRDASTELLQCVNTEAQN